jgi:hypothetical protein
MGMLVHTIPSHMSLSVILNSFHFCSSDRIVSIDPFSSRLFFAFAYLNLMLSSSITILTRDMVFFNYKISVRSVLTLPFFFFLWYSQFGVRLFSILCFGNTRFKLRAYACKARILPLESNPQLFFALVIFQIHSPVFWLGLASFTVSPMFIVLHQSGTFITIDTTIKPKVHG